LIQKLRRFLRTLFTGWHKRTLLVYFASLGPGLPVLNLYFRPWLLRRAGVDVGHAVAVMPRIQVTSGQLSIGKGVFINTDCRFACGGGITIGDHCQISARVSFETISHQLLPILDGKRPSHPAPIVVENNVWIGSGAILLPGITVGEGAVVAAGAVVTEDVRPFTVVGGVPAKVIKDLNASQVPHQPAVPIAQYQPSVPVTN
jgi:acetyltransferase-like isoleucine patch superfamily enzyme